MRGQMTLPAFRELPAERRAEQRGRVLAAVGAPRRRRPILVVAFALALLAATPTLAFQRELVDFWSAEPAPEPIQLEFDLMRAVSVDAQARGLDGPNWRPVGTAREVLATTVDGKREPLWVVATEDGGFCFRWVFHASCGRIQGQRPELKLASAGLSAEGGEGNSWVVGRVLVPEIVEVQLLYLDGDRETMPFVWVSPPIDAGFFAFEVPLDRQRLTGAIIGLDEDGNEVAYNCLTRSPEALKRPVFRPYCERPRWEENLIP
jgi:hypothetical protein